MKILRLFRKKTNLLPDKVWCKEKRGDKNIIIHHYCPHTYNAGDHFVIKAIRKYIKECIPHTLFFPKACAGNRGWGNPYGLVGENIEFSNRYADAVVIGGSDVYNNWSLRIKGQEIIKLIPPLFLVGLGVSSKDIGDEPRIERDSYLEDIYTTNLMAKMSSVRDDDTYRFLKQLGINKHINTGCPAMYLFDFSFKLKSCLPVIFTFPFPVAHKEKGNRFGILIQIQREILTYLTRKGEKCIISCHDDRDVTVAQEMFPQYPIFFSNYVEDYFDFYNNAKMVIGSRLHASLLVSGMGIPFININIDLRGKSFSRTFSLDQWNVDYNDPDAVEKLKERYHLVDEGDLMIFKRFYDVKQNYKETFLKFVSDMCDVIQRNV